MIEGNNEKNDQQPTNRGSSVYSPVVLALVLLIGIQLGLQLFKGIYGKPSVQTQQQALPLVEEVYSFIDARYVDTVDTKQIAKKVVEETLKNLDPHSYYIDMQELQGVNESLEGNFEGIGVEFSIVADTINVVTPIAGGPSESLGIQSGDKIVMIEDTLVAGIGIKNKDVIGKLRGRKGTAVKVGIARNGMEELIDYTITRDKIPLYSVDASYMMDHETGYLKINRFSATTYREFSQAMDKLNKQGMKKLILDLRQNPGGFLTAATAIADDFLEGRKLLVYTEGRNYRRKEYMSKRMGLFEQGELVIMLDQGSASASEILAGAVQDWDRGTIVGRRSFGKGLVQEQYDLHDGSAMRLTVARYYTPSGRCIQKPYEEGKAAYSSEILDRLHGGELIVEDSIKQVDSLKFMTNGGKIVYGGGGISPDVFVPLDTTNTEPFLVQARKYVTQFSYDHYGRNLEHYQSMSDFENFRETFDADSQVFAEFRDFLVEKKLKLDEVLLQRTKHEFQTYIKAYLAKQIWNYEGFYPIINEIDPDVARAYEVIQGNVASTATAKLNKVE